MINNIPNFNEEVINRFVEKKDRRIDLTYEHVPEIGPPGHQDFPGGPLLLLTKMGRKKKLLLHKYTCTWYILYTYMHKNKSK